LSKRPIRSEAISPARLREFARVGALEELRRIVSTFPDLVSLFANPVLRPVGARKGNGIVLEATAKTPADVAANGNGHAKTWTPAQRRRQAAKMRKAWKTSPTLQKRRKADAST